MEEQKKDSGQEMENKNENKNEDPVLKDSKDSKDLNNEQAASQAQPNLDGAEASKCADAQDLQDAGEGQADADITDEKDSDAVNADAPEDAKEDAEKSGGAEKKGFFKKNKKKDKKDEKIEELTDQVKRQMAEFDNFRKRTEKEKSQMYEIGAKSIIEKVLPVIDNFERGLAAVPNENKEDAFVDGMNKIYKQMLTMFEEADVKPIEAVGKEFDPNLHNAVMQTESDEYESGVIAQELQKGYMYRDSVVRHSMVAVVS